MTERPKTTARDLERSVRNIVRTLQNTRVPYMLIGAPALSAWGRPRATLDIDFMIMADDLPEKLVVGLAAIGFNRDLAWERHNPFLKGVHTRFHSADFDLDTLLRRDQHHDSAFKRRRKKHHERMFVWFPAPEDLILLKLRAGRPMDFEDVAGIFERVGGQLDLHYLSRWARRLGIMEELNYLIGQFKRD